MGNIDYLLSNTSDIIKFRVKKDFMKEFDTRLYEKIKESTIYRKRLNQLRSREKDYDFYGVHGATDVHLENAIKNVLNIGMDINNPEIKDAIDLRLQLIKNKSKDEHYCFDQFAEIILYPLLYKIGYRDEWLVCYLNQRLDFIYHFCKEKNYNIYLDKANLKSIPKNWQKERVISPAYYNKGNFQFPLIYDIVYLYEVYLTANLDTKQKIDTIIDYVISPEYYSKIETTYGILIRNLNEENPSRYMRMGWDCKIHGFYDFIGNQIDQRRLLDRLELFSIFDSFKNHDNFKKWLCYFNGYKTDYGTYILPKEYFKNHVKNNIEMESTFIIETIKRYL